MASNQVVKVVIFDLDGTLVDLPIDWDQVKHLVGVKPQQTLADRIHELKKLDDKDLLDTITQLELTALAKAIPNKDVATSLPKIQAAYKVAILTRNSGQAAIRLLIKANIDPEPYFIVGREDVNLLKPHPSGLNLILQHYAVRPDEAVLIGDSFHDSELAEKVGLHFILLDKTSNKGLVAPRRIKRLAEAEVIIKEL